MVLVISVFTLANNLLWLWLVLLLGSLVFFSVDCCYFWTVVSASVAIVVAVVALLVAAAAAYGCRSPAASD